MNPWWGHARTAPTVAPNRGVRHDAGVTHTRRALAELLEQHDLGPSRALGQNFVVDPNTVRRIARLANVGPDTPVVEIGAGLGSLTLALAETGAEVTAVETDRHLIPVLTDVLADRPNVRLVHGDALTLDWTDLLAAHPSWTLVANLPYNVATPLVLDLLRDVPAIERMLVMVQLEAGERLVAEPGSGAYGIPSVKVALRATGRLVGKVGPDVFLPRPRVGSALVAIVLDDMAEDLNYMKELGDLQVTLTSAILPDAGQAIATAQMAVSHKLEVIIHLPLEAFNGQTAGSGADGLITTTMSQEEIWSRLEASLELLPAARERTRQLVLA